MAYGLLYSGYTKSTDGYTYYLHIEKQNYTGSSSNVVIAESPKIIYPTIKKCYEFLFSSGCEFSLLSQTDRQFLNMFNNQLKVASDTVRYSDSTTGSTTNYQYEQVKSITLTSDLLGQARFNFTIRNEDSGETTYARIYRNGVAVGTEKSVVGTIPSTLSDDITYDWKAGDTCELWMKTSNPFHSGEVLGFSISYDNSPDIDLLVGYRVKIYKNSTLAWSGFIDIQNYYEDFNILQNYPVKFTANDGFKLLDNFSFTQADGSAVTGVKSLWEILTIIFGKIEWGQNAIYVSSNLYISGVTRDYTETVLHNTYVNTANFIDEDDTPMTCNQVLNEILSVYSLYLNVGFNDGYIYINDINCVLSGSSYNAKVYSLSTGEFLASTPLDSLNVDISTIGIADSSSTFTLVQPINSQNLTFSQFAERLVNEYEPEEDEFSGSNNYVEYASSNPSYKWQEVQWFESSNWVRSGTTAFFCDMTGSGTKNSSAKGKYLMHNDVGDINDPNGGQGDYGVIFYNKNTLPYINSNGNSYYILLKLEAYFRTKELEGSPSEDPDCPYARQGVQFIVLRVGDKQYSSESGSWVASGETANYWNTVWLTYQEDFNLKGVISDKWVYNSTQYNNSIYEGLLIPITSSDGIEGNIEIQILNNSYFLSNEGAAWPTEYLEDVRYRNVKIILTPYGYPDEQTFEDILYQVYYDTKYLNKGQEIKQILGTNVNNIPSCKGGLMYKDENNKYKFISYSGWSLDGQYEIIEKLKLTTLGNNWFRQNYQLEITTNTIPEIFGYITYEDYLPERKFMITGAEIDYNNNTSKILLTEFNT